MNRTISRRRRKAQRTPAEALTRKIERSREPVVVAAWRTPRGSLLFWCSWCRCWHGHGPDGREWRWPGTHRLAHCHSKYSPLREHGYMLVLCGHLPKFCKDEHGHTLPKLTAAQVERLDKAANRRWKAMTQSSGRGEKP